jgi:uncharacterized membrane protein
MAIIFSAWLAGMALWLIGSLLLRRGRYGYCIVESLFWPVYLLFVLAVIGLMFWQLVKWTATNETVKIIKKRQQKKIT